MDIALDFPQGLYRFAAFFVNVWFKILGDDHPDFYNSSKALAQRQSAEFNRNTPDRDTVYYQSYATLLKHFYSDPEFIFLQPYIRHIDGDNDGLCPVESAKWGTFKGIITTQGAFGISHAGVIDAFRVKYKGMDLREFYFNIAKDLEALDL
jgi:triacylglycerol lipase